MLKKITLLFHTLRYLKPIQFYWRIYLKLNRLFPVSEKVEESVVLQRLKLTPTIAKHESYSTAGFCFLNEKGIASLPVDWNNSQSSKLWLYNLHYFDYINQAKIDKTVALGLITDWIENNPTGTGNGWEPYTLSLRIVNWVKFLSVTALKKEDSDVIESSLFIQARFLFKHLEYHLLGNHLFKNGVALLFAGASFDSKESEGWLNKGKRIVLSQTEEQVLNDGGHFERSPMYHLLILEDILDCLNLNLTVSCFSEQEADFLSNKGKDMLDFIDDILHPDGDIPFFNDSATQIAASPKSVFDYAESLGVLREVCQSDKTDIVDYVEKPDFGLVALQNPKAKMIFDVGAIGPDYLPGHAHCDSLSYELSLAGKRCIVNSGTFQYAGNQRNAFRATAAHNTVRIDHVEQHEIWSTFRVARRGYPFDVELDKRNKDSVDCSASLSGFKSMHPVHKRTVSMQNERVIVNDIIQCKGRHNAESFIHLHPEIELFDCSDKQVHCRWGGLLFSIHFVKADEIEITKGFFSAEFGIKHENNVLVIKKQAEGDFEFGYEVCF